MARFLKDSDYGMQIKAEIKALLAGNDNRLLRAENTAQDQLKNYLGGRYDTAVILQSVPDNADTRDNWIVTILIDMAIYHLYSQTNTRDIPEHRKLRYDDAITWLRDVGTGNIRSELPTLADNSTEVDNEVRIWSKEKRNNNW